MSKITQPDGQVLKQVEANCREGGFLVAHVCDFHMHQDEPIDKADPKHEDYDQINIPAEAINERITTIMAELNAMRPRPQFVILGGDVTVRGRPGEWDKFFEIIDCLNIPWFLTVGNHDHNVRKSDTATPG